MFGQVILRPVRGLSASVHQISESVGNLLETMPSSSVLASLCCFAKERRDTEIVIAEVLTMTPEEDIDKDELEARFAELVVSNKKLKPSSSLNCPLTD